MFQISIVALKDISVKNLQIQTGIWFFFLKRTLKNSKLLSYKEAKLSNKNILFAAAIRIISASVFLFFFGGGGGK